MIRNRLDLVSPARIVAFLLAAILAVAAAGAQPDGQSRTDASTGAAKTGSPMHYKPNRVAKRAGEYYGMIWGVDSLSVKAVESGALIRFTYRVLDPEKAKILNDRKVEAFLDSPAARIRLSVPSLEKVGQLRQGNSEEAGKSYWMAFSNPRRTVKRGDHVNVVIGRFHADDLVVE
jgi:hypothetical protein